MANPNETSKYKTTPQNERNNFRPFSQCPEYRLVNRNFIGTGYSYITLPTGRPLYLVDVAAGTGLVEQEAIDLFRQTGIEARIFGVDPDAYALEIARNDTPIDKLRPVIFMQGFGQDLRRILASRLPEKGADWVSIIDAIHEIPDGNPETHDVKQEVISSMADLLEKDGILSLNSAFTTEGMGTAGVAWGRWISKAHQILGTPLSRTPVEVLKPETYRSMVTRSGLTIVYEKLTSVNLSKEALKAISTYPNFINGAITGEAAQTIPLEQRSAALIQALEDRKIESLPRVWYEVIGKKV